MKKPYIMSRSDEELCSEEVRPPDFAWVAENPRRRWWQFWKPALVRVTPPAEPD